MNIKISISGALLFISMVNLVQAQSTTDPNSQTPTQQPPPKYPVAPSPITAPNQVPQDPTIPKVTIPINAPTDSVFKKIDDEDKPFKIRRDSAAIPPKK